MIKFLNYGVGSGIQAANYMLARHDANGDERKEVQVLRGSPILVGSIVDTLKSVWRYTSGVISWHIEDNPSEQDIFDVLVDMESVSFAGLDKSQYIYSAVLHVSQADSKHVHWFTARVDLESGKHFNSAPPYHLSTFDRLCDKHNYGHGWARPNDMLRSRLMHPGPLWIERARKRKMKSNVDEYTKVHDGVGDFSSALIVEEDTRQVLEDLVIDLVFVQEVKDYEDLVKSLGAWVEVTSAKDKRLIVRIVGTEKVIRLSGELYRKTVDYDAIRQSAKDVENIGFPLRAYQERPVNVIDPVLFEHATLELDRHISMRTSYNNNHYPTPKLGPIFSLIISKEMPEKLPVVHEAIEIKRADENDSQDEPQSYQDALSYLMKSYSGEEFLQINNPVELNNANNERIRNVAYKDIELATRRAHETNEFIRNAVGHIRTTDEHLDIVARRLPETNARLGEGSRAINWCLDRINNACRRVDEFLGRARRSVIPSGLKKGIRPR